MICQRRGRLVELLTFALVLVSLLCVLDGSLAHEVVVRGSQSQGVGRPRHCRVTGDEAAQLLLCCLEGNLRYPPCAKEYEATGREGTTPNLISKAKTAIQHCQVFAQVSRQYQRLHPDLFV